MFPVSSDIEEFCTLCPKELGPLPQCLLVGLAIPIRIDPRRQIAMNVPVSKAPILLIVHGSSGIDTNQSQGELFNTHSFVHAHAILDVPIVTKGSPFSYEYGDAGSPFSRGPQNFMTPDSMRIECEHTFKECRACPRL